MILDWIIRNWIEIAAAALGIVYLILSIRQNILLWFFGLLTSALYIYVFLISKFYADMSLQAYYVIISIYGWLHWKSGNNNSKELPVSSSGKKLMNILLGSWAILWVIMWAFLNYLTDSEVPIGDGFTTAGSVVATWMLARKIKEHWIFWIIIDFVSLVLYIDKGLYPTAVLFFVYTTMAVIGYIEWLRDYRKQPVQQVITASGLQRKAITI
ncbi:MAG: nicotinamide riboside transporter PnuC [Salinivirgaceae bacterium]|nr:MAG: nicotinamide riboside transporter PnuC [Salinivirgaceae bacterium]